LVKQELTVLGHPQSWQVSVQGDGDSAPTESLDYSSDLGAVKVRVFLVRLVRDRHCEVSKALPMEARQRDRESHWAAIGGDENVDGGHRLSQPYGRRSRLD
jgi:hypothetical protein